MNANGNVKPGQVWEDNDWRSKGRRVRVLSVDATHATVQSPTGLGRKTRIRLDRFRLNSTGYRLVSGDGSGAGGREGGEGA